MQNSDDITVRDATVDDLEPMARIYNHYIRQSTVTFEEEPITTAELSKRIDDVRQASLPWLAAERGHAGVGYAYATKWRVRPAYRYSVETTVYVAAGRAGQRIGSHLYERLLSTLQAVGIRAAMGGIALPNDASVALHEKFGFKKVAHFENVGFKFDRWIDVGYWQRNLGNAAD